MTSEVWTNCLDLWTPVCMWMLDNVCIRMCVTYKVRMCSARAHGAMCVALCAIVLDCALWWASGGRCGCGACMYRPMKDGTNRQPTGLLTPRRISHSIETRPRAPASARRDRDAMRRARPQADRARRGRRFYCPPSRRDLQTSASARLTPPAHFTHPSQKRGGESPQSIGGL